MDRPRPLTADSPGAAHPPAGRPLSGGGIARLDAFTDLDGSRPDAWHHLVEARDAGRPGETRGYRPPLSGNGQRAG
ncbi:hypothetical protein [Streptomyces sp. AF1A]|uniref:hypothetical protein n=1 Tax=Streptomyces sp. AF1A TaxID=3394350 RepID=UPI0039BD7586